MSDSRGIHFEAVGFASLQVEELEGILGSAMAKCNEVLSAIHNATGPDNPHESAQNALGFILRLQEELIPEAIGMCENSKAELTRYSGGF